MAEHSRNGSPLQKHDPCKAREDHGQPEVPSEGEVKTLDAMNLLAAPAGHHRRRCSDEAHAELSHSHDQAGVERTTARSLVPNQPLITTSVAPISVKRQMCQEQRQRTQSGDTKTWMPRDAKSDTDHPLRRSDLCSKRRRTTLCRCLVIGNTAANNDAAIRKTPGR